ncbi:MAG: hypothetical protein J5I98_20895 [Phaeodactylibacter sp.]|nr:hypothetical protein [Phaeodactylibacter sp.]
MTRTILLAAILALLPPTLFAQAFEVGFETVTGTARTTFRGSLAEIAGFSEVEISEGIVDSALANAGIDAPRWLKELFPGIRIEVTGELQKKLTRNVNGARFFARYHFLGASFTVSDPRLTEKPEARKLKNQVKSVRLALAGKAEELAEHLALLALDDATKVEPFFSKRYDVEAYLHLKKLFLPNRVLLEWGKNRNAYLDVEVTPGIRFSADPSPVVDLGSVLLISEKLDSLMEGGILRPLENTTDQIAEAIQNVVFGKFKDPRTVPAMGGFVRAELLANFGSGFSGLLGTDLSFSRHTSIKGTQPMYSTFFFAGLRWGLGVGKRK